MCACVLREKKRTKDAPEEPKLLTRFLVTIKVKAGLNLVLYEFIYRTFGS